jgi:hypothetical protein
MDFLFIARTLYIYYNKNISNIFKNEKKKAISLRMGERHKGGENSE